MTKDIYGQYRGERLEKLRKLLSIDVFFPETKVRIMPDVHAGAGLCN